MDEKTQSQFAEARRAISQGRFEAARQAMTAVLASNESDTKVCAQAWWILSHSAESKKDRIEPLKSILLHYPENERVIRRLKKLLRSEAGDAKEKGDNSRARYLLKEVLEFGDHEAADWQALLEVAESEAEKITCLERIVEHDPENDQALQQLEALQQQTELEEESQPAADIGKATEYDSVPPTVEAEPSPQRTTSEEAQPPLNTDSREFSDPIFTPTTHLLKDKQENGEEENSGQALKPETSEEPAPEPPTLKWNYFFQTEKELCDQFSPKVEELLARLERTQLDSEEHAGRLEEALAQRRSWTPKQNVSLFLAPAVTAATDLAENMLDRDLLPEAFETASVFGEFAKVLTGFNQEKYLGLYTRLLTTACCALGKVEIRELRQLETDEEFAELDRLRSAIDSRCLSRALATFYNRHQNEFKAAKYDEVLSEHVMHDALAWCFERRLETLVKENGARLAEYVEKNMPLAYSLNISENGKERRKRWEQLIEASGHKDVLNELKETKTLINPQDVGYLSPERMAVVARAEAQHDYHRVNELLTTSASDLRSFLQAALREKLVYREPPLPSLNTSWQNDKFRLVQRLTKSEKGSDLMQAIKLLKEIWMADIDNWNLQDWLAYLKARLNHHLDAEQMLQGVQNHHHDILLSFNTDWNLAVLYFQRSDCHAAYQLLLPYLDTKCADDELITVLLALALELGDRKSFLSLIPHTLTDHFLPLAFNIAYELGDKNRQKKILTQLLKRFEWQLPPVGKKFPDFGTLQKTINKAIVEGQVEQAIMWLQARIRLNPNYHGDYVELARLLERKHENIDSAFQVLSDRLRMIHESKKRKQNKVNDAGRDLLLLCRRGKRDDLGKQAYERCREAKVAASVLTPFEAYAPNTPSQSQKSESRIKTDKRKSGDRSKTTSTLEGDQRSDSARKSQTGLFIDHENFLKTLEEISARRAVEVPSGQEKVEWFAGTLEQLVGATATGASRPRFKVAVAFWSRIIETHLMTAYFENGFVLQQPENIKLENAVDFKLADEVRRAQRQAQLENAALDQVIIVSGDGDYVHMVRDLVNEGVRVQIWGGRDAMNSKYADIVGEENVILLDDVCQW